MKKIIKLLEPTALMYRQNGDIKLKTKKLIEDLENYFIILSEERKKSILEYWGEEISENLTEKEIWKKTFEIMDK